MLNNIVVIVIDTSRVGELRGWYRQNQQSGVHYWRTVSRDRQRSKTAMHVASVCRRQALSYAPVIPSSSPSGSALDALLCGSRPPPPALHHSFDAAGTLLRCPTTRSAAFCANPTELWYPVPPGPYACTTATPLRAVARDLGARSVALPPT